MKRKNIRSWRESAGSTGRIDVGVQPTLFKTSREKEEKRLRPMRLNGEVA